MTNRRFPPPWTVEEQEAALSCATTGPLNRSDTESPLFRWRALPRPVFWGIAGPGLELVCAGSTSPFGTRLFAAILPYGLNVRSKSSMKNSSKSEN
jgi:hypothetical protein